METKFKPGDVIEGYEGGDTWGNSTTLLLIHVFSDEKVYAFVIKSFDTVKKQNMYRHSNFGNWGLNCRDWKKIGELPNIRKASEKIESIIKKEYGIWER